MRALTLSKFWDHAGVKPPLRHGDLDIERMERGKEQSEVMGMLGERARTKREGSDAKDGPRMRRRMQVSERKVKSVPSEKQKVNPESRVLRTEAYIGRGGGQVQNSAANEGMTNSPEDVELSPSVYPHTLVLFLVLIASVRSGAWRGMTRDRRR